MWFLGGRTLHTCSSEGPFLKNFLMQNAYFSNTCPKYGGAWPFHWDFIVVAWWRPLGGLWGLWGSIWAKILNSSRRRTLGAYGILSEPRVVTDACPPCGHLVPTSCPPCGQLVPASPVQRSAADTVPQRLESSAIAPTSLVPPSQGRRNIHKEIHIKKEWSHGRRHWEGRSWDTRKYIG